MESARGLNVSRPAKLPPSIQPFPPLSPLKGFSSCSLGLAAGACGLLMDVSEATALWFRLPVEWVEHLRVYVTFQQRNLSETCQF
ncbi:hypothetical protein MHYP_G00002960 [Metynnis hypsauchen]